MRLNRFYTQRLNLRKGSSLKLEDSNINHIRKVLRLKKDDQLIIFNGIKEYVGKIKLLTTDVVMIRIIEVLEEEVNNKNTVEITLFQSLLRAGKFDLIIEKTTELGINNIIPVEVEFSQTKVNAVIKKIDRWKKVAIAASKQSERITIPEIYSPIFFKDIEKISKQFDLFLFFTLSKKEKKGFNDIKEVKSFFNLNFSMVKEKLINSSTNKEIKKIAYIIGPEGGFSPTEHQKAIEWGLNFVSFGKNVLRSETASIALLSIIQYYFNN